MPRHTARHAKALKISQVPLVHFCCCLDGHPPQPSGGAFHRVSTVQSPGSRIDWEQRHFRCDGRRVRVSWCSAGQLQLQRHREAHLLVQWVRDDDGITYMIMNVPFKPSRIVTSEGYLVVFVVVSGAASSARPPLRLSPQS